MTQGIVYVLVNEAFDSYVKIGKTINLEQRIRQLDNTSSPLPFRCVFAVEVADMDKTERLAHSVFADQRVRTNRDFFEVDQQRVIAALQLTGGRDVTPRDDIVESIEDTEAIDKVVEKKTRRSNTLFQADLNIGDVLYWHNDESITCTVTGERKIRYWDGVTYWSGIEWDPTANEDEPYIWESLSSAALCILNKDGYKWKSVNGWRYWMYDGETIAERLQRVLDEKARTTNTVSGRFQLGKRY